MNWSAGYVGIPWTEQDTGRSGTHCWGLVRLVYAGELAIDVEDFGAAADRAANAATIEERRKLWPWREVAAVKPFDIVVYKVGRLADHVGIMVERGLMLHVAKGRMSEVASIRSAQWRDRIIGFHRHVKMLRDGA